MQNNCEWYWTFFHFKGNYIVESKCMKSESFGLTSSAWKVSKYKLFSGHYFTVFSSSNVNEVSFKPLYLFLRENFTYTKSTKMQISE